MALLFLDRMVSKAFELAFIAFVGISESKWEIVGISMIFGGFWGFWTSVLGFEAFSLWCREN